MTGRRITLLALLAVVVGLTAIYRARNPERLALDDPARDAAGGRFVALDDGITHYDVAGPDSGERVMLVHGFSVPSYIWDSTVAGLTAAGFRVARYDVFGRGFSDRPDTRYNVDLFDRQLSGLLDSLGWDDAVHIVGLSYGGVITGAFTGRHPDRVRSLTLVDPAAGPPGAVPGLFRLPLLGPLVWQTLAVPSMDDNQLSDFVEPARWSDWPGRYRVQMQYRGFGRALLSTLHERASVDLDTLYARVGATNVPVMLVWGTQDQTVPISNAATVRTAIPQVEYRPIDGAGHLPHMEQTVLVNDLLIRFLRSHAAVTVTERMERLPPP